MHDRKTNSECGNVHLPTHSLLSSLSLRQRPSRFYCICITVLCNAGHQQIEQAIQKPAKFSRILLVTPTISKLAGLADEIDPITSVNCLSRILMVLRRIHNNGCSFVAS